MSYAMHVTLEGPFEEAVDRVKAVLQSEGLGVLSDIDVAGTLKAKMGVERSAYRILGACNPPLANWGLDLDPDLGVLMPCNVVVREEDDGSVTAALMGTDTVFNLSQAEGMAEMAGEAQAKLEQVRGALEGA